MKRMIVSILCIFILPTSIGLAQAPLKTKRIPEFSNASVNVWKSIIYPSAKQVLAMHRHDFDRVLVALTDGTLKVTNNRGKIHYLRLKKDTAYFLKKDIPNEMHTDENITSHPIKVMVIELRG